MRKINWNFLALGGIVGLGLQSISGQITAQNWEQAYRLEHSVPQIAIIAPAMKLNDGGWFVNLPDGRGVVLEPKGEWYTSVFRSQAKGPEVRNLPGAGTMIVFPVNGERICIYGPMRWPARKNGMCYLADAGLR